MTRFSPDFLDELRARLRASDVIGRHVKLKKEGREWRGLSPFTNEKTPSFYVNDEKARYFDFSSNKSGDVIHFLMEHQKLSFVEAVTRLAEEAGLALPQDDPQQRVRDERAKGLAEACGAASAYFSRMLERPEGADARAYLDRRMVGDKARRAFGLGYAPGSRTALKDHLTAQGFAVDVQVEAGLLIRLDDGTVYDRFRDRLMFPILGTRDRVIAFGGRALSKDAKAKYLNSPETPLFHKSRVLYDFARARRLAGEKRAGEGRPLLVCEGYMDVIAAVSAGFPATAPLGTALTEGQLALLWRAADEPVLCFDGDRAGKAAAYRALDRALPLLTPGKSLRFAFLPDGRDPDDLVRQDGPEALRSLVGEALPLAEVLWSHHQETHSRRTPEEAAGFKRALWEKIKQIKDRDVGEAYGAFIRQKLGESAPRGGGAVSGRRWLSLAEFRRQREAPSVSRALKAHTAPSDAVREAQLVLTLIHHPRLFTDHEDQVLALDVTDLGLKDLLGRTIDWLTQGLSLDSGALRSHLLASPGAAQTYERWSKHPQIRMVARLTGPDVPYDLAEEGWLNALSIDRYQGDLAGEVAEAAGEAHLDPGREKSWFDAFNHRARLLAENKPDDED